MNTRTKLLSAGAAGLACGALAGGLALASSSPTVKTASNASLGKTIVVDGKGRTLYELRPETSHHLLCTKVNGCYSVWPPLTVKSAHARLVAGPGVKGKLSILRHYGVFRVALSGHPLYRFAGDTSRGDANGQGIKSFGGTWHVVATGPAQSTTTNTTSTDTTTTDTTPSYTYPPYR